MGCLDPIFFSYNDHVAVCRRISLILVLLFSISRLGAVGHCSQTCAEREAKSQDLPAAVSMENCHGSSTSSDSQSNHSDKSKSHGCNQMHSSCCLSIPLHAVVSYRLHASSKQPLIANYHTSGGGNFRSNLFRPPRA